jgi:hypothetical protein
MDDGWSVSSEASKEPDKNSPGFQIKTLLDGEHKHLRELPDELRQEHENWDREFPDLTITGTKIPVHSNAVNEKQQLKMAVATQLVRLHLWPEVSSLNRIEYTMWSKIMRYFYR